MRTLKRNITALSFLLIIPILHIVYVLLNNSGREVHSLLTDLDREIPFVKMFVLPYLGWFVYIAAVMFFLCFKDKSAYYNTLMTLIAGMLVSFTIYYFYQTMVQRPVLKGDDILTKAVALVYSSDKPYNCFPSLHCMTSFIMIKGIFASKACKWLGKLVVTVCSFLIILSTLYIKQHVVLDALSAILLGGIIFDFFNKYAGERILSWLVKTYWWLTMRRRLGT